MIKFMIIFNYTVKNPFSQQTNKKNKKNKKVTQILIHFLCQSSVTSPAQTTHGYDNGLSEFLVKNPVVKNDSYLL